MSDKWYDNNILTEEQQLQQVADFFNMFYGDKSKQMCFAYLIASVENQPTDTELAIIRKDTLRDFIKLIKTLCGLDVVKTTQSEAVSLNTNLNK